MQYFSLFLLKNAHKRGIIATLKRGKMIVFMFDFLQN